jgi:hypothetical protein
MKNRFLSDPIIIDRKNKKKRQFSLGKGEGRTHE